MTAPLPNRFLGFLWRIGVDPADSSEVVLQKNLVVAQTLWPAPAGIIWTVLYLAFDAGPAAYLPAVYSVLTFISTAVFAVTRNLATYRRTQLLMILVIPFLLTLGLGGIAASSAVILWSALCPLTALLFTGGRYALLWLLSFIGLVAIAGIATSWLTPVALPPALVTVLFVLNIATVVSIAVVILRHFVAQRDFFQGRSEELLLNILPKEISDVLKAGPRTVAEQHENVSILFADVVGFTRLSANTTPEDLVRMLEAVFRCFDDLVDRYGLEKIKTIGDCYMIAAGVPRPRADHAEALVALALDMRDAVARQEFAGRRLTFRIGINSGAVVAGVIGRKKFIYDLWGEAVNLASRMESHGEGGAIQISRATYELVKDRFVLEPRGLVAVKGAGEVSTWHVVSRKTAADRSESPREADRSDAIGSLLATGP